MSTELTDEQIAAIARKHSIPYLNNTSFIVEDVIAAGIREALRASPTPAREGFVMAPKVPTYEMVQAGAKLVKDNLPFHTGTKPIYEAMLAAAPTDAKMPEGGNGRIAQRIDMP